MVLCTNLSAKIAILGEIQRCGALLNQKGPVQRIAQDLYLY